MKAMYLVLFLLCLISCSDDTEKSKIIVLSENVDQGISPEAKQELAKLIGDRRIVMIGEQVHGVGDDYISFLNMTRFLHEDMGFDIIAQEFCFYSFGQIAQDSAGSATDYAGYMYWPQGKSEETFLLLDYIDNTQISDKPIIMEGFDPRIWDKDSFGEQLQEMISSVEVDENDSAKYLQIYDNLKLEYRDTITDTEDKKFFLTQTDYLISELEDSDRVFRHAQELRNLKGYAQNAWNIEGYPVTHPDRFANRFRLMAENLIWLADKKYPDKKIIVRLHNGHAVKNLKTLAPHLPDSLVGDSLNMGSRVYEHFGDNLFIIGSTYYTGTHGKWDFNPMDIPRPPIGSLEDSIHTLGLKYAMYITDKEEKLNMYHGEFNSWMPEGGITATYGKLYDAILFIDSVSLPTER